MSPANAERSGGLTPAQALRAAEVLELALDAAPSRRVQMVRDASAGDETLAREVMSLLNAHEKAGAFLQPPMKAAALVPGSLLGSYRVIERIGSGGMGDVYRARDEALGRSVAIKVLSDERARDSTHIARLEREARALAALNHPNIAAIYAVQSARDGHGPALVLELAAGRTLAQILERGPLAVDEAVAIATQVARALEAAHGAGIVHRDLKPANIAVAEDGTVKVLDFGLAKSAGGEADLAIGSGTGLSPVITQAGMLVGTIAYMSPEQARGKAIDRRADMWAFGCVLYEMLTGRRLFGGDDASDVFRRVIAGETDLSALPTQTPGAVRSVIERATRKDIDRRLRDAGDARIALEEALAPAEGASDSPWWRTPRVAIAAGVVLACSAGVAAMVVWRQASTVPIRSEQYSIVLPPETSIVHHYGPPAVMHPKTRDLYFTTYNPRGGTSIVRRVAEDGSLKTDEFGLSEGFGALSPDGRRILHWGGVGNEVNVRVRDLETGADVAQFATQNGWNGITWLNDRVVAIAQANEDRGLVLWDFVADKNWSPAVIGKRGVLQPARGGDDRSLLLTLHDVEGSATRRGVYGFRDDGSEPRLLMDDAQMPMMMGTDILLFYRGDGIWAVKVDIPALRVMGPEISVVSGLAPETDSVTRGMYTVSPDGDLLYLPTTQTYEGAKLVWVDAKSNVTEILQVDSRLWASRLSPDATRVAYIAGGTAPDLYVHDLARGTSVLVAKGQVVLPVWTRDNQSIMYQYVPRDGSEQEIRQVPADGSTPPKVVAKAERRAWAQPTDVTPDGKHLLVAKLVGPRDESDIYRVALDGSEEWEPVFATHADRTNARISADGRLIAYTSKESGDWAVYVQPYPSLDRKVRVSVLPAFRLSWAGSTLFFRGDGDVYSVDVTLQDALTVSTPTLRFTGIPESRFDALPDGSRIIQSMPLRDFAPLHEMRVWLGAEGVIRTRLEAAAKAARR